MKRERWTAGWTRINENEFKRAIAAAMGKEPDLCQRLRLAIRATAACDGVAREVRDQYIRWVTEVEAALAAVAEAQRPLQTNSPQAA